MTESGESQEPDVAQTQHVSPPAVPQMKPDMAIVVDGIRASGAVVEAEPTRSDG